MSRLVGVVSPEHTPDLLQPYRGPRIYERAWRKGGALGCVYTTYSQGPFQTRQGDARMLRQAPPETPSAVDCIFPEVLSPSKMKYFTSDRCSICVCCKRKKWQKQIRCMPTRPDFLECSRVLKRVNFSSIEACLLFQLRRVNNFSARYCWVGASGN